MILETAVLQVKPGMENDFESDFRKASSIWAQAGGYFGHELHKCIETKGRYLLTVRWRTLKDHTIGFRQSPGGGEWERLLQRYCEPGTLVEHYIAINLGDTPL